MFKANDEYINCTRATSNFFTKKLVGHYVILSETKDGRLLRHFRSRNLTLPLVAPSLLVESYSSDDR